MILEFLSIIIAFATFFGFSRSVWWFTILDFFRLQYACLAFLLLCAALYEVNISLSLLNTVIIIVNLYRIRGFFPRFSPGGIYQNKQVFSVNAYKENSSPERLKKIIKGADPEILLIMEMTDDMESELSSVLKNYQNVLSTSVRDGFRICLYSKSKFHTQNITLHGPGDTPLLHVHIQLDGVGYDVFAAHPKPALNKDWYDERHAYFKEVELIIKKISGPVIVLGDFNSVPWEEHFVKFLHNTNLKSTVEGYGYNMTWPVFFPLLGIPMDHILITRDEKYTGLSVGPYIGSDHFPVGLRLKHDDNE